MIYFEPAISESEHLIQFKYEGFTQQQQFGQYFCLTLSDAKN